MESPSPLGRSHYVTQSFWSIHFVWCYTEVGDSLGRCHMFNIDVKLPRNSLAQYNVSLSIQSIQTFLKTIKPKEENLNCSLSFDVMYLLTLELHLCSNSHPMLQNHYLTNMHCRVIYWLLVVFLIDKKISQGYFP